LLSGYFGGYGSEVEELGALEVETAVRLAAAAAERRRPLVVHTLYPDSPAAGALRSHGVLVYAHIERAVAALAYLAEDRAATGVPKLPEPDGLELLGDDYCSARALLATAGLRLAEARRVHALGDLGAAAAELDYPLVLKSLAHG